MKLLPYLATAFALAVFAPAVGHAAGIRDNAVQTCVNAYYGIGEPVDYAKAYKCFHESDVAEFMIIMELNGEGTPQDPHQAQADADRWFKGDPGMGEIHQLRIVIQRHLKDPHAPKADFCKDIAYSMYSIGFCSGVDDALAQQDTDLAMKKIRESLGPNQQAQWDKLQDAFGQYQKAEGLRIYKQYEQGTIRGVAYDSQVDFVRANFQKLMMTAFSQKRLGPATAADAKTLADKIQAAYEGDVRRYVEGASYLNGSDSSADEKEEYVRDIAEYKQDAETSQKSWESVRNLCLGLAAEIYKQNGVDWSASMAVALSELRLKDIYNDPVGGG